MSQMANFSRPRGLNSEYSSSSISSGSLSVSGARSSLLRSPLPPCHCQRACVSGKAQSSSSSSSSSSSPSSSSSLDDRDSDNDVTKRPGPSCPTRSHCMPPVTLQVPVLAPTTSQQCLFALVLRRPCTAPCAPAMRPSGTPLSSTSPPCSRRTQPRLEVQRMQLSLGHPPQEGLRGLTRVFRGSCRRSKSLHSQLMEV
jgi:hypothetical protein